MNNIIDALQAEYDDMKETTINRLIEDGNDDCLTDDRTDIADLDPEAGREDAIWSDGYMRGVEEAIVIIKRLTEHKE